MRVRVVQLYQRADAHARGAACRRSMLAAEPTRPVPVWLWFEYSRAPPRYIQLNIQALRRQAPWPLFRIEFVNRSTIAQHVPDLPAEFWRLPTRVAYSDAGRLALLAHHGGIYLDADFLVSSHTSTSRGGSSLRVAFSSEPDAVLCASRSKAERSAMPMHSVQPWLRGACSEATSAHVFKNGIQ